MNTVLDSPQQGAKMVSKILTGLVSVIVLASLILIQNKTIEKWNGTLPQVTGGAMPLLDLNSVKGAKQ